MKLITLSLAFLSIAQIAYSQDFITKWTFDEPTTEITFSTLTTDTVQFTWEANPSGNSGNGSFIQTASGPVTLNGLNVMSEDTLTLSMETDNLSRFYFEIDQDQESLIDVHQWGDAEWASMSKAFSGCYRLHSFSAMDTPDLRNVTSMDLMFYEASNFNEEIGHWDVSNVTNIRGMFYNAESFNQDIGGWDVSNVTDMSIMFVNNKEFNQDISNWDVSKVIDMSVMFQYAKNFNQDIGSWDVSSVTNMSGMFSGSSSFNQDIGAWDVSNVIDMFYMFASASIFNQDIGGWDVSNVTDMSYMFSGASSFNHDVGGWDVSNVIDMWFMFSTAENFNQDLGNWELHPEVFMANMLDSTGMDCDHYSATLIGWQKNNPSVTDIILGAHRLQFGESASVARDSLINKKGWSITGDVEKDMPCDKLVSSNSPHINDQSQLLIYPNPAQDQIYLPLDNLPYKIISIQGKAVQNGRVEGQRIPVEYLPTGLYILKVRDDQKVYQAKFVKE